MLIWVDAQLSPSLAPWMSEAFDVECFSVARLGYLHADDETIFRAAGVAGAVVMTKDSDFVRILEAEGPPPRIIWVAVGNSSNAKMKSVLERVFPAARRLLEEGEPLVEISDL